MKIEVFSEQQTRDIGFNIGKNAKKGEIYCLCGDLGAGKTHFSKGFALGLGIKEEITSPTFSIVNEYNGDMPFYHFDVYRISDVEQMYDIGYEEYFFSDGVCLIEWAELIKDIIPKEAIWVKIEKDFEKEDNYRMIEVIK